MMAMTMIVIKIMIMTVVAAIDFDFDKSLTRLLCREQPGQRFVEVGIVSSKRIRALLDNGSKRITVAMDNDRVGSCDFATSTDL